MRKAAVFILVLLLAVSYGCRKEGWKGRVYKEGDVEVVENPSLSGASSSLKLVRELTIGKEEGPNELVFFRISFVAADSDGNVYVLDGKKFRLSKFSKDGKFLWAAGRQGEGPGEFVMPSSLQVVDGKVVLVDRGRRLLFFDAETGKFLEEKVLSRPFFRFYLLKDGRIYAAVSVKGRFGFKLGFFSPSGQEEKIFDEYLYGERLSVPVGIGGFTTAGLCRKHLLAVLPDRYEIREYSLEGKLERRIIVKGFKVRPPKLHVSKSEKGIRVSVLMADALGPPFCLGERVVLRRNQLEEKEATGERRINQFIEIFDEKGRLLSSLKIEPGMWLAATDGQSRLYFIQADPFPAVVRMRIE